MLVHVGAKTLRFLQGPSRAQFPKNRSIKQSPTILCLQEAGCDPSPLISSYDHSMIILCVTLCHVNSGRWHDRSIQDALPKCAVKSVTVRKNSRQFALTVVIVLAVLALSLILWPALLRLVLYAIHQTRTHTSVCHWCLGRLTHLLPTYLHYDTISAIMPILLWIAFTCPCLASY